MKKDNLSITSMKGKEIKNLHYIKGGSDGPPVDKKKMKQQKK